MVDFFTQLPVEKLLKYKVRYDIRFRKNNGDYARILYQGILLEHDEKGKFLKIPECSFGYNLSETRR